MAIVDINVVKVSARVCIVDSTRLNAGDTPRWNNQTGDDIIVFFPHDNVLGNGTGHFHHKLANNGSYHHPGAASRRTPPGQPEQYSYAIYCLSTSRFAVGGSDPEIIVF